MYELERSMIAQKGIEPLENPKNSLPITLETHWIR